MVLSEWNCGPQKASTASNFNFLGLKITSLYSLGWLQTHDPPASLGVVNPGNYGYIPSSSSYFTLFIKEESQCGRGGRGILQGLLVACLRVVFLQVFP